MDNQQKKWVYLIGLSLIWGSSFILIKKGLLGLTAFQLGALRMFFTSLFLFAYDFKSIFSIPKDKWKWIIITAFLSTFFPAFFFSIAQTKIDSSIVSVLNSMVPLFALIIGAVFFKSGILKRQVLGVIIGLIGTIMLIFQGTTIGSSQNYAYSMLIIAASLGYAANINIVKHHLEDVSAVAITVGNFLILFIPAVIILLMTSFFSMETLSDPVTQKSIVFIVVLSLFGTAIAKVVFNQLVKISSPVFTASVTYIIPIVAIALGLLDGERFNVMQLLAAFTIMIGVYLVNKKKI